MPVLLDRPWDFLTSPMRPQADEAGIYQALIGTFWIGVFVVVLAFPLGIAAALYLEEYAADSRASPARQRQHPQPGRRALGRLRDPRLHDLRQGAARHHELGSANGRTIVSAGLTIAILVLPIVIITASEAVRAVPAALREGGFGVGATRWEVIRTQVLPYAAPGILTGTCSALARALGEAAPLLLVGAVGGRLADDPSFFDLAQLRERFVALPIVITEWTKRPQPGFVELAAAAIIVMLVIVLLANTAAILLRNHFEKKRA